MHLPTSPNPAFHSPAVLKLIGLKVTDRVANHLAEIVIDAVDTALKHGSTTRHGTPSNSKRVSNFKRFVCNFIQRVSAGMPIILVTLVYIVRAKKYLRVEMEDRAYERVFLGAFIIAAKYTNDAAFRSVRWVLAAVMPGQQVTLGKPDVNRIEREFLGVLDYQLGFAQEHILVHYDAIIRLYSNTPKPLPNPPSPFFLQSPSKVTMASPVRCAPPKDNSTPVRKSVTSHDSSTPRASLYPTVVASQPYPLMTEEAKRSRSCASDLTVLPLPWHSSKRTVPEHHIVQRISV